MIREEALLFSGRFRKMSGDIDGGSIFALAMQKQHGQMTGGDECGFAFPERKFLLISKIIHTETWKIKSPQGRGKLNIFIDMFLREWYSINVA